MDDRDPIGVYQCVVACLSGMCLADVAAPAPAPVAKEVQVDPKTMTCEQSLQALVNSFVESKLGQAWQYFPPSYRKDLTELTHLAIARIDPEVYDQTSALAKRFVKVMKDKKPFIFENNAAPNKEDLERAWDRVVVMLETLLESDLSTHASAKKIDLAAFFEKTGSKLFADLLHPDIIKVSGPQGQLGFDQIQSVLKAKISVVRDDGDKVLIRIEVPGKAAQDTEYRRVEGQWFPSNAVKAWPGLIANRKAEIEAWGETEQQEFKQRALPLLALADRLLTNMENAKTAQEFQAAISPLMQMMGRGNDL